MNSKTIILLLLLAITGTVFFCRTCTTKEQYVPPLPGNPLKEIKPLQQNEKRYNEHIKQLQQESSTLKQKLSQSLEQLAVKRIQYKNLAKQLLNETQQPGTGSVEVSHTQALITKLETKSTEKDVACDSALAIQGRLLVIKDSAIAYTGRQYHLANNTAARVMHENWILTRQVRKQKRTATVFKIAATVLTALFITDKLSPD